MINTDRLPKQEDLTEIDSLLARVFGDDQHVPLCAVSIENQEAARDLVESDSFAMWSQDFIHQEIIRNYMMNGVSSGQLSRADAEVLVVCAATPQGRHRVSGMMMMEGLCGADRVIASARVWASPNQSQSVAEFPRKPPGLTTLGCA